MQLMLIEKDPMARRLMEIYIERAGDMQLVSSYAHWDAARENGIPRGLQLVLADAAALPFAIGGKAEQQGLKIIALLDADAAAPALDGADSLWIKNADEQSFLRVIRSTVAGERVMPTQLPVGMIGKARSDDLTSRELEVLREIVQGRTDAEIANTLCLSVPTVKYHIRNLREKTGLINRTQLAVAAEKAGL